MTTFDTVSEARLAEATQGDTAAPSSVRDLVQDAIYAMALAMSLSVWFIAIRAPLWLDENISTWQINAGFSHILSRQGGLSFPAYSYILWLCSKIIGTSEIALRVPEILAMLGAVYLLYRAARELFDRDVAIVAAVVFCLHPIVIFASIDVRPYAFGALAINAAILCLLRLRRSNSNWLAALFGLAAAFIVYFHLLFAVILPALAIGFFMVKSGDQKRLWRQFGVALAAFAVAFLPVVPAVLYMFHTSGIHVFDDAPILLDLGLTLAPKWMSSIFVGAALIAAATRRLARPSNSAGWRILFCASLGLIPILILYGVSTRTSIHVFVPRYRLVAIPGIALCWALLLSLISSRAIRLMFCVVLVATSAIPYFSSPYSSQHGYTWKYALEYAEKNASADNAPVLICSDLPEADHMPMPVGAAVKDSNLFAPLSYYKLSVPVVGLPRTLNDESMRIGSSFLLDAVQRRERFLALAFAPSYRTLHWLKDTASATHEVHHLKTSNGILVLEFTPRTQSQGPR